MSGRRPHLRQVGGVRGRVRGRPHVHDPLSEVHCQLACSLSFPGMDKLFRRDSWPCAIFPKDGKAKFP